MSIRSEIFNNNYFQKQYRISLPPKELQQEVAFFWQFNGYWSTLEEGIGEQIFANLSASLVFNLGSPFRYYLKKEVNTIAKSSLIAAHTLPIIFEHYQHNQLFGIKLNPAGLHRILGINAATLNNQIITLVDINPQFQKLEESLITANFDQACLAASQFLWSTMQETNALHKPAVVSSAIRQYQTNFEAQVKSIAQQLFISPKTLSRYFKEILGISPKTCFNIIRLRTALKQYAQDKAHFSIYNFGYTDYSHFVKEVKRYTHHIPSQLEFISEVI